MDDNQKGLQGVVSFRPAARILVIDDSSLNRSFVINAFSPPDYEVFAASSGYEGIEFASRLQPELILLDIMMPEMDGFDVAKILKNDPATRSIPIIFITALDAIQDKLKAFDSGAVDFVTKPFNHKELIARVKTNVQLRRMTEQRENMLKIAMEEKRNAAIARIAAGVSHNFNNMLGVLFGNIMFIETRAAGSLDKISMDALVDVRRSLERMQSLVKKFLLLANRSSEVQGGMPSPAQYQVAPLIDDVISDLVSQKASCAVPLQVTCSNQVGSSVKIYCDSSHLREIFNLMLNELVEITAGKSTCLITAKQKGLTGEVTDIILEVDKFPFKLDSAESIFEPFAFPIANVGSGLSFSAAKYMVELNGGKMSSTFPEAGKLIISILLPAREGAVISLEEDNNNE